LTGNENLGYSNSDLNTTFEPTSKLFIGDKLHRNKKKTFKSLNILIEANRWSNRLIHLSIEI